MIEAGKIYKLNSNVVEWSNENGWPEIGEVYNGHPDALWVCENKVEISYDIGGSRMFSMTCLDNEQNWDIAEQCIVDDLKKSAIKELLQKMSDFYDAELEARPNIFECSDDPMQDYLNQISLLELCKEAKELLEENN